MKREVGSVEPGKDKLKIFSNQREVRLSISEEVT